MKAQRCSHMAVLVRACARALTEVPRANAAYRDGRFELYPRPVVGISLPTREAFLFASARRMGYRMRHHVGHYPCPADQRSEDETDRVHRLRQLRQNVEGLIASCTSS